MSRRVVRKKRRVVGKRKQSSLRGRYNAHMFDIPLLVCTIVLLIVGVIAVYNASIIEAYNQFGDQLHFAKLQFQWTLISVFAMMLITFIPIDFIKKIAFPVFVASAFLLLLVLIPGLGVTVGGAQRWLNLGVITIQPSEIAKVSIILYLAALFEKETKMQQFLGTVGLIGGLIMLQPDLGTTIMVVGIATIVFFAAGAKYRQILPMIVGGGGIGLLLILSSSYRRARLMTFLDPNSDPLGSSYHIRQIIISLGSGGFWGTGIGRSVQKYQYLPEATTDSIFAVIAEETGFIGTLFIMTLYAVFTYRGFAIVKGLDDSQRFLRLLGTGITCLIILQAFLNLSAMAALVPLTGITLPFISYGRSSLVVSVASVGLLLNISRYTLERNEKKHR